MSENGNGSAVRQALDRLSHKQRAFVLAYTGECRGNGSKSVRVAGYGRPDSKDDYYRVTACNLLTKPNVIKAIRLLYESQGMTEEGVIAGLTEQARASISMFLTEDGQAIDFDALMQHGHLIKSLTPTKSGLKIELHSSQRAYELIGRHLGMFKDRLDITSSDERIGISQQEHARAMATLLEAIGAVQPGGDS